MEHGWLPVKVPVTVDAYAEWHPEHRVYSRCGAHVLNVVAVLEDHIGGPLTVQRLRMLAAMKGCDMPEGGFSYEAAAIRKLKGTPTRGCPPHIRDQLIFQLARAWPSQLPFPNPKSEKDAA
jgi:hypothetical protein